MDGTRKRSRKRSRSRSRSRSGSTGSGTRKTSRSSSSEHKLKRSKVDVDINQFLINACFHNQPEVAIQLLLQGANANYIDQTTRYTPLLIACEINNIKLVEFLIEMGANINLQGFQGGPFPLDLSKGKVKKLLLTQGANGTVEPSRREKTPLVDVKEYSNPVTDKDPDSKFARLSIRIRSGANKKTEEVKVMKALSEIIDARRENPTQYYQNPSINLNQLNKHNKTLLAEACQRGKEKIVKMLIQAGADVNLKGSDNYTPLGTAILHYEDNLQQQSLNIIRELLENGADINMEYAKNQFPLIIACYKGYIDVVELLLRFSRVNVNITDNNGDTPLIAIIEEAGHDLPCKTAIHLIKLLIHSGADVNLKNSKGESPTIIAGKNKSCPELVTVWAHYGPQFNMGPPIGLPRSRFISR